MTKQFFLFFISLLFCALFETSAQNTPLPCLNKKFSIVAHNILNEAGDTLISETQISAAIDEVNGYFEDICVSFEVCDYRIIDNFQYDSLDFRKNEDKDLTVINSIEHRINMYFIEGAVDQDICGLATLEGIGISGDIWILKNCINPGNPTIAHELGHFFGLEHTFKEPSTQLADGSNCATTGDKICDTPADPYVDGEDIALYVEDCEFYSQKRDANGDFYDPDVSNIMSYYTECACDFTDGQLRKMAQTYLNSNPKNW